MKNTILKGSELDEKKASLGKMEADKVNWKIYYINEKRKEKWVEEYLYPEMQEGGPSELRLIEEFP